ncbi:hypothetical protein [Gramella sp. KN1008]|nr:hypothetical protein [Gramella sp. KN1008]
MEETNSKDIDGGFNVGVGQALDKPMTGEMVTAIANLMIKEN